MSLLVELHFLPSLEYFCAIHNHSAIVLESHEHFVKQSYRNRCYINTAQGVEMMSVPLTMKGSKTPIRDVRIDYTRNWKNHHWRTIESAYRKAPFYEHYESGFRKIIYANHVFLFDLNRALLSFCLTSLKWEKELEESTSFYEEMPLGMKDLRNVIVAKKPFAERGIYQIQPYYQVFGSTFVGNLSILDLLFCEGPQGSSLLKRSQAG